MSPQPRDHGVSAVAERCSAIAGHLDSSPWAYRRRRHGTGRIQKDGCRDRACSWPLGIAGFGRDEQARALQGLNGPVAPLPSGHSVSQVATDHTDSQGLLLSDQGPAAPSSAKRSVCPLDGGATALVPSGRLPCFRRRSGRRRGGCGPSSEQREDAPIRTLDSRSPALGDSAKFRFPRGEWSPKTPPRERRHGNFPLEITAPGRESSSHDFATVCG